MTLEEQLQERSKGKCELCEAQDELIVYHLPPEEISESEKSALLCDICYQQVSKKAELNPDHWHCLTTSMWSETPAIQVLSWRMLNRLKHESWATEAIDMLYLDDELLNWAKSSNDHLEKEVSEVHRDSLGNKLENGDSVVLTKSLDVKGSQINARIGTVVKNIRLVHDNTEQIEGKVEGQQIVILTKFLRKVSV